MGSYNYKGYEISIEHAIDIEGFQGDIIKDGVRYSIVRPVECVTHIRNENVGSLLRPKYQDIEYKQRLYDETFQNLKKDLETIVDGIECFMVAERNNMVKEFKEKEDILKGMCIEIRDYREEK